MGDIMKGLKFPFEINMLNEETNNELLQYFHGEKTGFVQVGPEKYFFPYKYKSEAENYYNFKARHDDVWIVTFPRSGTTWTQELVWLIANNLDFETAKRIPLTQRFPFFEFHLFVHPEMKRQFLEENAGKKGNQDFIECISTPGYVLLSTIPQTERRFIKSHFPFSLLPPSVMEERSKIIYVARRNAMDVAVSYYHLNRLYRTQGYVGDFKRYWNYFQKGLGPWMPYYSHIREAFEYRNQCNVLYLQYEEMTRDLPGVIEKISKFLNLKVDESKMDKLLHHLDISNFRLNTAVNGKELEEVGILNKTPNGFVRTGGSGLSISEFQAASGLLDNANKWIQENELLFEKIEHTK
ncbi:sulfotransferase 1C4 [Stomoxys calcitrans]|uniref:sulfotransferase 1C4 n=1 Tax=Stomoxys calcitrans TaxID=35570 RepID=UPI0027E2E1E6|nr:sulfotransferase 1C4 [Stomoxys calcitrans]